MSLYYYVGNYIGGGPINGTNGFYEGDISTEEGFRRFFTEISTLRVGVFFPKMICELKPGVAKYVYTLSFQGLVADIHDMGWIEREISSKEQFEEFREDLAEECDVDIDSLRILCLYRVD
jgi:hypothetical protein